MPVIRQKVVLHIVDSVKASCHGGPSTIPKFMWEPKTLYFGTDPVALDKTGWKVIDARRREMGLAPVALSKPDEYSHYLNGQVEHIELAGMLGLGEFSDDRSKSAGFGSRRLARFSPLTNTPVTYRAIRRFSRSIACGCASAIGTRVQQPGKKWDVRIIRLNIIHANGRHR